MLSRVPIALLGLTFALGCSEGIGQACTAVFVYGLTVEVRDSATGIPAGNRATVQATSGAYVEQLVPFGVAGDSLTFVGAGERPGQYVVSVNKAGYRPWQSEPVLVDFDGCHVKPVLVDVRLRRIPPG